MEFIDIVKSSFGDFYIYIFYTYGSLPRVGPFRTKENRRMPEPKDTKDTKYELWNL